MACKHKIFNVEAKVARLTESDDSDFVTGYHMDVTVICAQCFKPFRFVGLPSGYSPSYPTVDVEEITARMPIEPVH